jgi:uncharacterized protein YjbJ (UPF0337 family)
MHGSRITSNKNPWSALYQVGAPTVQARSSLKLIDRCLRVAGEKNRGRLSIRLNENMMNRDQWNGRLKQLKGALKKQWGTLTGNTVLETMGELERLLGVFQRQYGHLKDRERRECQGDRPYRVMDGPRQEQTPLVLIQGSKRARHTLRRMRPICPSLERT